MYTKKSQGPNTLPWGTMGHATLVGTALVTMDYWVMLHW